MPHFYKGYDKYLDVTEEEYWAEKALDYFDEEAYYAKLDAEYERKALAEQAIVDLEGEPFEDTYLPGIPDYDRFNQPSWEVEE